MHARMNRVTHTHTHTQEHTHTHSHSLRNTHTHAYNEHTYAHLNTHAHAYTHMHTHIHTHAHTHTHTHKIIIVRLFCRIIPFQGYFFPFLIFLNLMSRLGMGVRGGSGDEGRGHISPATSTMQIHLFCQSELFGVNLIELKFSMCGSFLQLVLWHSNLWFLKHFSPYDISDRFFPKQGYSGMLSFTIEGITPPRNPWHPPDTHPEPQNAL